MKKDTVEYWLNQIQDNEVKEKALRNCKKLDTPAKDIADAIIKGFSWSKTPEENAFWNDQYKYYLGPGFDHSSEIYEIEEEVKTVSYWLDQIREEDVRQKALNNVTRYSSKTTSISGAINLGFIWEKTEEGSDYWVEWYNTYSGLEINTVPREDIPEKEEIIERVSIDKIKDMKIRKSLERLQSLRMDLMADLSKKPVSEDTR